MSSHLDHHGIFEQDSGKVGDDSRGEEWSIRAIKELGDDSNRDAALVWLTDLLNIHNKDACVGDGGCHASQPKIGERLKEEWRVWVRQGGPFRFGAAAKNQGLQGLLIQADALQATENREGTQVQRGRG